MVSLMKAIEAGADIVDTSISSLSLGPGHNPTEALVEMLGDRLRTQEGPASEDQGPFRQGPPAVRRVRVEVHRGRDRSSQSDSGVRSPTRRASSSSRGPVIASRRSSPRCPKFARTRATRLLSRHPARSWAPRPCSTC
jgi:hypothetical protein